MGDSILDFLIADILFSNASYKEAQLTRARANLACEDNLSKVFEKLNLEPMVKLGKSCKKLTKAIKGDIVESVLACIYIDAGIDACRKFILDNFDMNPSETKDYKTAFQEFAQKYKYSFEYRLEKTEGPAHSLVFYMELYVNGNKVSQAHATSKMEAEKMCAKIALEKFQLKK